MAVVPVFLGAGPAAAWTSTCTPGWGGDSCIYYNQYYGGAHGGENDNVADFYPNYYYFSNGSGAGTHVWNNNGSNRNMDIYCTLTIYYSKNYGGASVVLGTYGHPYNGAAGPELGPLLNNIRSQMFCV